MRPRAGRASRAARAALATLVLSFVAATGQATTPAATAQAGGLLRLVAQTPAVLPDGEFVLRVRVAGAPSDARLGVFVHNRVTTRSGFARSLEGLGLRTRVGSISTASLEEFEPDPTGTVTLTLSMGEDVRASAEGVYPVVVHLSDSDGATLSELITHLIVLPDADADRFPPLSVAVVLPVGAPPALQPDGTVRVESSTRDGIVAVASVLSTYEDVAVTLVPVPETVDSLAASGDPTDRSVLTGLERAARTRQILAAPYVRLDLPAWVDAGMTDELAAQFDRGSSTVTERLARPDGRTWVANQPIDAASVSYLRRHGVDQLVVPEAGLTPLDERDFPITLTRPFLLDDITVIRAVMADGALSDHVGATGDPTLDAHRVLADLAVLYHDLPPLERAAVLSLPASWQPSAPFLEVLLSGLDAMSILDGVTLDRLFATVPPAGQEGMRDDDGERLRRGLVTERRTSVRRLADRLNQAREELATYRSVVGDESSRPDELETRILVAGAAGLSATERAAYLDPVVATIRGELAKVEVPGQQSITLTAREGRLPLTFHNEAGYPMTVVVELESDRLEFPDLPDGLLTLVLADELTRVELDVLARGSGSSPLHIVVRTPDQRIELGSTRLTVRSTAFSGVGLVLSIGAGSFLLLWWARSIRRTLRSRRAANASTGGRGPHGPA